MFKYGCSVFFAVFLLILLSTGAKSQKNKEDDSVEDDRSKCIIPAADAVKNGRIGVESYDDDEQPSPGTKLFSYVLRVYCNPGYTRIGEEFIQCITDRFSDPLPKCIGSCKSNSPELLSCGMGYNDEESQCLVTGSTLAATSQTSKPLECGRPGESSYNTVANGTLAIREDAPWHAGVYKKTTRPYMQICGGTIISANVIISAAHCFWSAVENKLPAENFAVAVGKLYRPWDDPQDTNAQKSDIKEIRIPPRFQGSATNFQDDIAALVLVTPIKFTTIIVPVCLDFDYKFDVNQLAHGNNGRVVGWGLTSADGAASQVLNKAELPVVGIEQCIAQSQPEFLESITSDKICAGYNNGTSVCRGDSGGGLAFEQFINNAKRYFLRGLVSTAPTNDHLCNVYSVATFTHIFRHEHFIKEALEGNPAPEVEVTTKSTLQLVNVAIQGVNKENADRPNANLQTTTEINGADISGGMTINDMDEPDEPGKYMTSVFIPLKEYPKETNSTIMPCINTKNNMTACKDNRNGVDTNERSETEAPITNPPPTISNEAINQKGINQGVLNPLALNQGVPNQAGVDQGGLNQAVPQGSINDKLQSVPGPVGINLGFNQHIPNQGLYKPQGIHQGVLNQGGPSQVPNQLVLNQGVLSLGVPNQAGVLQQIPLQEPSVDKSKDPTNLHWMANYDYQQYWHNSPNNQQINNRDHPYSHNDQQYWHNSPNNQPNTNKDHQFNSDHQEHWHDSPNNQQDHQNGHGSPYNQQNHQNWHHSHNWHNSHDHQYNWHKNWDYQHKPEGQYNQNWQSSHQDGHW